jgi:hypothetical protein
MKNKPLSPEKGKSGASSIPSKVNEPAPASSTAKNAHKGHSPVIRSNTPLAFTPSSVSEMSEQGAFSVTGRMISCSTYESRNGRGFALLLASSTGAPYSLALAADTLETAARLTPGMLLTVSGRLFSHVVTGAQGKPFYSLRTAADSIQVHSEKATMYSASVRDDDEPAQTRITSRNKGGAL